jgi:hypothetical protein
MVHRRSQAMTNCVTAAIMKKATACPFRLLDIAASGNLCSFMNEPVSDLAVPHLFHKRNRRLDEDPFQITFSAYRRPGSRPKGGGGLSTAFHARPITSPAVASGRRPRRGKRLLSDVISRPSLRSPSILRRAADFVQRCNSYTRTCSIASSSL